MVRAIDGRVQGRGSQERLAAAPAFGMIELRKSSGGLGHALTCAGCVCVARSRCFYAHRVGLVVLLLLQIWWLAHHLPVVKPACLANEHDCALFRGQLVQQGAGSVTTQATLWWFGLLPVPSCLSS